MRLRRWKIIYIDPDTPDEEIAVGIRQVVEIERKWPPLEHPQGAPQTEAVCFAAFLVKGGKPKDADGFDAFLDTVEDMSPVFDVPADDDVDPSIPVAGDA